jgi:basic membrane protein A and related proteins
VSKERLYLRLFKIEMLYDRKFRRHGVAPAYIAAAVVVVVILAVGAYVAIGGSKVTTVTSTSVATSVSTSVTTATQSSSVKTVKVALIMEGPQQDASFNQAISADLASIVAASGGTVNASYIDNVAIASVAQVAGTYAQEGYNLVVGDTNDYAAGFQQAAAQFPNTDFSTNGNSLQPTANAEPYAIWANEAAYVEGYLASYMTHTNKLGDVVASKSGTQLAWTNGFLEGASQGATEQNKTVTVTNAWTNTFTDPSVGLQAAQAMLSSGVDVIAEDASAPGSGAQSAVGTASHNSTGGPWAMGAFTNQNNLGPYMLSSTPWDFTTALQSLISQVQQGTFGNQEAQYFMHTGAVSVVMSSTVPAAIQAKVNTLIAKINQGTQVVPLVISPDLMPSNTATVPPVP